MTLSSFSATVLADSINSFEHRITTFEVNIPRFMLPEFNTHRVFSRNSASSRAIPVHKMLEMVRTSPMMPIHWGANQSGMQADIELSAEAQEAATREWLVARDAAVAQVERLLEIGVHKQLTNRLLEPFLMHRIICTATEWSNFFALRCDPAAQPEIRAVAELMRNAYMASTPQRLSAGQWHLPLIFDADLPLAMRLAAQPERLAAQLAKEIGDDAQGLPIFSADEQSRLMDSIESDPHTLLLMISTARCARVSYLTHGGKRDLIKDLALHHRLVSGGHMSPCEHPARPMTANEWQRVRVLQTTDVNRCIEQGEQPRVGELDQLEFAGNTRGFVQYRKLLAGESDFACAQQYSEANDELQAFLAERNIAATVSN